MVYRRPNVAPRSLLADDRRGRVVGQFCHGCGNVYPLHRAAHKGKPTYGKDHVSSPCVYEGEPFADGADWWEPAVEVLPPPPAPAEAGAGG